MVSGRKPASIQLSLRSVLDLMSIAKAHNACRVGCPRSVWNTVHEETAARTRLSLPMGSASETKAQALRNLYMRNYDDHNNKDGIVMMTMLAESVESDVNRFPSGVNFVLERYCRGEGGRYEACQTATESAGALRHRVDAIVSSNWRDPRDGLKSEVAKVF